MKYLPTIRLSLTLTLSPEDAALARLLAIHEHRSLSNLIVSLLLREAAALSLVSDSPQTSPDGDEDDEDEKPRSHHRKQSHADNDEDDPDFDDDDPDSIIPLTGFGPSAEAEIAESRRASARKRKTRKGL